MTRRSTPVDAQGPDDALTPTPRLSDEALTRDGLAPTGTDGRILLIGCGALAREILDLIALNGWSHMDLVCLPAILHNTPDRITEAVAQVLDRHHGTHAETFVLYADCGTGGQLQALCAARGVQMMPGPHCYAFYEGVAAFAAKSDTEFTSFYLTDFLVRQFDAFVWKPLGLDRHPELLRVYFGHYTTLVYQAQTEDPALEAKARDCAARMGLTYERRHTGYGDMGRALAGLAGDA